MTAVVTGGAGFIGSHLCEALLERGEEVVCIDNLLTGDIRNLDDFIDDPRFRFIEADIGEGLPEDLPAPDVIFNLACPASPKDFEALSLEILDVCSRGMVNVLELARESGAVLVQASTSEVYGEPEVHPQIEDYWGHVSSVGERSCYDEGKRYAEALVMAYRRRHGVDARLARIFNTYGPRMRIDDGRVVPNFVCQALGGRPLTIYGDGMQTRSFCYVADTVAGLLALADADPGDIDVACPAYNIGNGTEITVLEFAECVMDACGTSAEVQRVPLPQSDDPTRRRPDTSKLTALTGWRCETDLATGLALTTEWFAAKLAETIGRAAQGPDRGHRDVSVVSRPRDHTHGL